MVVSQPVDVSWIDRVVFWNKKVVSKSAISPALDMFVVKNKDKQELFLKFKYAGNTQFHKVTTSELQTVIDRFNSVS
ncbi:MAG: hypothetical protein ACJAZW_000219 [Maritalea sp.]|jgi:hypothetical protein